MKRIIFIVLAMMLMVSWAFAADVPLKWDAVMGATGYKVYKSEDLCVTWGVPVDVGNITTYVYVGVDETKMIHFRISAYNANGESIRYWSGAWYNHLLKPISAPPGAGIQ